MSPGFMFSTSLCRSGESSDVAIGPTRPPLAFDALAETSAATVAKSSPPESRARMASAFFSASSSLPTLIIARPCCMVVGTSIRISRSVIDAGSTNSFGFAW